MELFAALILIGLPLCASSASPATGRFPQSQELESTAKTSTQGYNESLQTLERETRGISRFPDDYRIGPEDLLEISVYGAPDLSRTVRVSARGIISLPLVGNVSTGGLTSQELETVIEGLLQRSYMTNPQVSVFVKEIKSHPVSILGAVGKPGVYQIEEPKTLIEVLSLAQGLADDAGDKVIITRHSAVTEPAASSLPDSPPLGRLDARPPGSKASKPIASAFVAPRSLQIDLKDLLSSANPAYNVEVFPGDVVKVPRAGIVYVVGEVRKPGGFLLRTNENISVLQALALAEGAKTTASKKNARIIRTKTGEVKEEIPINLKRILAGKETDPLLHSRDILFIPNSTTKSVFYRGAEAAVSITGGLIVYRW